MKHEKFTKHYRGPLQEMQTSSIKSSKLFGTIAHHKKNIIYERYTFWSLQQEEGESIDSYLMWLKLKIDTCKHSKDPAVSNQIPPVEPPMARAPPSNEVRTRDVCTRSGRIVRPPARYRDD